MDKTAQYFQSTQYPQFLIRDANEQDDPKLLALIAETMPSNGMVLSFERLPSYFQATQVQYNHPLIKLVVSSEDPESIIAMMNLGAKSCFINEQLSQIRYVSDLRIQPSARGKYSIEMLMAFVHSEFPLTEIFQSVVLVDNKIARHILHQEREFFPQPYIYDQICTYTIARVQKPHANEYSVVPFEQVSLEHVSAFKEQMKKFYNFLPDYDFSALLAGNHPFWRDIDPKQMFVVYDADENIKGMFGLWNQKAFKQTKVVKYSKTLKWIKPFYNFYASLFGLIKLPQEQHNFDYLMAHCVLCDPNDATLFEYMLYQLHLHCKKQGNSSFCLTLSEEDPRNEVLKKIKTHKIHAIHALHSFESKPFEVLDQSKISFFEVGRI